MSWNFLSVQWLGLCACLGTTIPLKLRDMTKKNHNKKTGSFVLFPKLPGTLQMLEKCVILFKANAY